MVPLLLRRIAELEARLAQNSSNSSRPPSCDPPGAPPPTTKPPTGRPRGAQKGHKRHRRELLPPERVDAVHHVKPTHCRRCSSPLAGEDVAPVAHQVVEIPRVLATATEYRLHRLRCRCGAITAASLPDGVPLGHFGPRLCALVATLTTVTRIPKRPARQLLWDLFGVPLALGSVSKCEQRVSDAIRPAVAQVATHIRQQPVVHVDETGWTEAKHKAWLWVAVVANAACFLIRRSRASKVALELLGDAFRGRLVSDRWPAYLFLDAARRQLCWAHLLRHFVGFEDHGEAARALGLALQRHTRRMFRLWHRVRDGTLTRADFQWKMRPIQRRILALLRQGRTCVARKVAVQCNEILTLERALFTFVGDEGIEPTNNAAERALRHAVIWRKSSFGTDSERGSRFVERMLTVVTTLRLQHRNVLEWLTDAMKARFDHRSCPTLITPATTDQAFAPAA
jgi:transposase